jgi:hypothetical protein
MALDKPAGDSNALQSKVEVAGIRLEAGELVALDYVHRAGQYRTSAGELRSFVLHPDASLILHGEEADVRDIELGTKLVFIAVGDAPSGVVRLAIVADQLSSKGTADPAAAEAQRKRSNEFLKTVGLPGRVVHTDATSLTVEFFSRSADDFKLRWLPEFAVGKDAKVCVANDELRTWNPPVDGERGQITKVDITPPPASGSAGDGNRVAPAESTVVASRGGVRITFKVTNMLEGFRRGRYVRVFGPGWKAQDQPYGQSLMGYGFGRMLNQELVENVAKEYPEQFPFRTDYGNKHLPWYRVQPGVAPPPFAEHVVYGSLVEVDAAGTGGKLLTEFTGESVTFTLLEKPSIKAFGKAVKLTELPLNRRYRFQTYQDADGRFTLVGDVRDQHSHMAATYETYRITSIVGLPNERRPGRLYVARQIPKVKDYNGDMQRTPDFGACELLVDGRTQVTRDGVTTALSDLKTGDMLLVNRTAELPGRPSICTEIRVSADDDLLLGIAPKR